MRKFGQIMARIGIVILVTLVVLVGALYFMMLQFKNGPSESAKNMFVTTILETGQMKFLAHLVCSDEEIQEIVNANSMQDLKGDVDASLITIGGETKPAESTTVAPTETSKDDSNETTSTDTTPTESTTVETTPAPTAPPEEFDANGIRIEEISGRTFLAKMLIIKDPSQVKVATTYPWGELGLELDKLVANAGAVAGVNGGLYVSSANKGGSPIGVVVQDGVITYNGPSGISGLYMIGFNNQNILIIKNIEGYSAAQFEQYVAEAGIRDAVAFQDEASDADNHFVPIIINGEPRQVNGSGSGANPRTAIGQRADGAVLLLVTDGRGTAGHLGATASDLIDIMQKFGAVNAANIDGGSSSSMIYNGNWEMNSVTFYFQSTSWKLPTSFVVMPK